MTGEIEIMEPESAALERRLRFEKFSHEDGWNTAMKILELYGRKMAGREVKKGIGIRIVADGVLIFQYLMDGKKNDSWLIRKQNTVEKFGHSSMYIWEVNERTHEYEALKVDPAFAVCGGAFPLIIGGEIRGMIAVSGLAHYEDHELIVKALEELKEHHRMIFEAMNIHYLPMFGQLKEHLSDLGPIKIVSFNYSQYSSRYDAFKRGEVLAAFDPKRAGGALMDINVYNIHAAVGLFGRPESIRYEANVERDIDTSGIMTMDYGKFKLSAIGAKDCKAPVRCTIQGTEGCIVIAKPVNQMESFELILNDGTTAEYKTEHPEHRLYYEFVEFQKMMETEDWERHDQMLAVSLAAAEILEEGRRQNGIFTDFQ